MIDTRAVAQEVQDQLLAAMQRGQEQLRKSQDQVRQGREAVSGAIRTGNQLVKSVRPNIPTLPPSVHVPSLSTLPSPAKLRANAQELADHVTATRRSLTSKAIQAASPIADQMISRQRELTGMAIQAASPVVTESFARLTKVVGTLNDLRRSGRSATVTPAAVAAEDAKVTAPAKAETAAPAKAEPEAAPVAKPRSTRPRTAGTSTAKASTATASTDKAGGATKPARASKTQAASKARATDK
jgi:hypothetical protein